MRLPEDHFTESGLRPWCIGVRLLKERDLDNHIHTRRLQMPHMQSWYATRCNPNESSDERTNIHMGCKRYPNDSNPHIRRMVDVSSPIRRYPLLNGEKYNILSDGRIGEEGEWSI